MGMLSGLLFPLITFPYSARIIGVEGIGQVRFFSSIITYISLLSSLGIPIYAIREIAKVRDDLCKMVNTTAEILLLHLFLTLCGYLVIVFICMIVPQVSSDIPLFLVLSASLLFGAIGCEWLFAGIEDFKFITIRAFVVRVVSVIILFTCVHSKDDLLNYAVVTVLGTVGNNLFNIFRLRHLIPLNEVKWKQLRLVKHLYPSLKVFALYSVINLYTNFNAIILGFFQNNEAVGYYAVAAKVTSISITVVGALQTVTIPRFSYLANQKKKEEFNNLCQRVVDFVLMISIPSTLLTAILAPSIIRLFCGDAFDPAITTLIILSPIILFVSLSGIPCYQILYPQGREKEAIRAVVTGGIVNLLLCFFLVPFWSFNGAAVALVLCEVVVLIAIFFYGKKYIPVKGWTQHYQNCAMAGSLMLVFMTALSFLYLKDWLNVFLSSLVGLSMYLIVLFIREDETFLKLRDNIVVYLRRSLLRR